MSFSETETEIEQCCLIKEEGPGDLTTFSALQRIKYTLSFGRLAVWEQWKIKLYAQKLAVWCMLSEKAVVRMPQRASWVMNTDNGTLT